MLQSYNNLFNFPNITHITKNPDYLYDNQGIINHLIYNSLLIFFIHSSKSFLYHLNSLNPISCFPLGSFPSDTYLSKVALLILRCSQAAYLLIPLSFLVYSDNTLTISIASFSDIFELPASIS